MSIYKKKVIKSSRFGPIVIIWSLIAGIPKVDRVFLSRPGLSALEAAFLLFPDANFGTCAEINLLCSNIEGSLSGSEIKIPLSYVRLDNCPPFQKAVLCAQYAISFGCVITYGLLAARLGRHGAARAVGNALARNPFPIIIPCHRAIRSDCSPGEYQGGPEMKRILLENEGIILNSDRKIVAYREKFDTEIV